MTDYAAQILIIPTIITPVPIDTGGTSEAQLLTIPFILSDVPLTLGSNQPAQILSIVPLLSTVVVSSAGTVYARFLTDLSTGTYINRVFDSIASKFVLWRSSSPDITGTSYPGPGTFGVHTADYVIITKEV